VSQKAVYLDVCALSRPFDDQGYLRIKLETDAVNMILSKVKQGKYKLLFSSVHIKEIEAYNDILERVELQKHNIKVWCGNPVAFCEKEKLR
jgi:hypothetical protein